MARKTFSVSSVMERLAYHYARIRGTPSFGSIGIATRFAQCAFFVVHEEDEVSMLQLRQYARSMPCDYRGRVEAIELLLSNVGRQICRVAWFLSLISPIVEEYARPLHKRQHFPDN
ncbi:hypothetical protein KIN20_005576 [Parelaphostrongylus tenuis]|uniref:Uncharacterized protein n=1 Tax=Parelaphostrongylus tenuis TaxID=148309 RepID=A0AAD5QIP4_PARTN|nr:hypothetical protein KIN20_005576 [Parelaphostrongylus tenuis]